MNNSQSNAANQPREVRVPAEFALLGFFVLISEIESVTILLLRSIRRLTYLAVLPANPDHTLTAYSDSLSPPSNA